MCMSRNIVFNGRTIDAGARGQCLAISRSGLTLFPRGTAGLLQCLSVQLSQGHLRNQGTSHSSGSAHRTLALIGPSISSSSLYVILSYRILTSVSARNSTEVWAKLQPGYISLFIFIAT
ncbi:hypothetical protein AAFF_G00203640 [Aldrovandia affinis]|uniref:Uncharacterized protein n=1 Tax=Aldrovandia affinis TaxID=143900 RepID=A0AAD7WVC9_9TELE|nr:hypothetical protein AAFF_G00203640 [Aldrovandia affinis]